MRYAFAAAALIAGAVAVPLNQQRDIVTDVDIVYETQYVTVTAGQEPAYTAAAAPETTITTQAHWGHHSHNWPSSSYVAPAPEVTSIYVAPAPSTTEAAPAYEAPAASAPAYSAPAAAVPTGYAGKVVLHHNLHRANHSAPALEWDEGLAATAGKIAASCVYAHNTDMDNGGYGQNIAAGVKPDDVTSVITDLFYNGEVGYYEGFYGQPQPDMSNFKDWGHFSQIVWKDTTHVGCATQDCSAQGLANVGSGVSPFFTVCNYKNPGNYANQYGANVGKSLKQASIDSSYGL